MPKVGDRITVTISGPSILRGTLTIGQGSSVGVAATIVEDLGNSWLIQLDISVAGKNRMIILKSAIKV